MSLHYYLQLTLTHCPPSSFHPPSFIYPTGRSRPVSLRKERQSGIRGGNRAEEGWADKDENWRKEKEMEE
ncbi:hypothetical protein EYF80_028117 [Liparis tanakae]|uniref:Uncharacterized protein n=1 Tax=Liparis tanakae TaxID=230148 RepID=A0A4Z2H6Z0_9TELE|nr:hypothetical protein EYF80_028117 [Liparis tanakae]